MHHGEPSILGFLDQVQAQVQVRRRGKPVSGSMMLCGGWVSGVCLVKAALSWELMPCYSPVQIKDSMEASVVLSTRGEQSQGLNGPGAGRGARTIGPAAAASLGFDW